MSQKQKESTQKFYNDIREHYRRLAEVDKEFGVQKLTDEYIFCTLGKKFYRAPSTIENIVYDRV